MKNYAGIFLAVFLLIFSSCDQIKSLTNLFSKDAKITEKKSDKKSKKKKETAKDDEKSEEKKSEETEELKIGKEEKTEPLQEPPPVLPTQPEALSPSPEPADIQKKEELLEAEPTAPPKPQVLIESLSHFAGVPTALDVDLERIYVGYGNKLAWYDHQLVLKGGLTLDSPITKIQSHPQEGGIKLYVTEEGNTLEIIELKTSGEVIIHKTLEADGPFVIGQSDQTNPPQLFIFLKDRIQVLDLANLQAMQVKGEIPLNRAREAYRVGTSLFVLTENNLHVVNLTSLEIRSSISLGQKFTFLGTTGSTDALYLILGQVDDRGGIKSLKRLLLAPRGEGIVDLGISIDLPEGAQEVTLSGDPDIVYFIEKGEIKSLNMKMKQTQPVVSSFTDISFIRNFTNIFFVASDNYLGRLEPGAVLAPTGKSPVPLAIPPTGSSAVVSPRSGEKKLFIAGKPDFVGLPGGDVLLISHNLSSTEESHPPFFLSKNFSKEGEADIPIKNPGKGTFQASLARPAGSGWMIWDGISQKIFFLQPEPPLLTDLKLPAQNVVGLDVLSADKLNFLFVSVKDSAKKWEALQVYSFDLTRKTVRLLGKTDIPEIGGVRIFDGGKKGMVACGSQGICFLEGSLPKSMMKEVKKIAPPKQGDRAVDIALSPDQSIGYVFFESTDSKPFISLIDLKPADPVMIGSITNLNLQENQFRGLTFSAGGGRLLLPNDQGLAVYNVKNPASPRLEYLWPLGKTFSADVTQRGQVVCAALGDRGVECGSFP